MKKTDFETFFSGHYRSRGMGKRWIWHGERSLGLGVRGARNLENAFLGSLFKPSGVKFPHLEKNEHIHVIRWTHIMLVALPGGPLNMTNLSKRLGFSPLNSYDESKKRLGFSCLLIHSVCKWVWSAHLSLTDGFLFVCIIYSTIFQSTALLFALNFSRNLLK